MWAWSKSLSKKFMPTLTPANILQAQPSIGTDTTLKLCWTHLTEQHPDKFMIATEACVEGGTKLGDWYTADIYASDILDVSFYCNDQAISVNN